MTASLGIDLGERRIGIALAEDGALSARPLATLRRGRTLDADLAALRLLVDAHDITALVIGLPLEAAGQEGTQAALTRGWVEAVAAALEREVTFAFRDERLSSYRAEQRLGPMRRGRSGGPPTKHQRDAYRARVDREAAAIILQDALDARLVPEPPPATTMETTS